MWLPGRSWRPLRSRLRRGSAVAYTGEAQVVTWFVQGWRAWACPSLWTLTREKPASSTASCARCCPRSGRASPGRAVVSPVTARWFWPYPSGTRRSRAPVPSLPGRCDGRGRRTFTLRVPCVESESRPTMGRRGRGPEHGSIIYLHVHVAMLIVALAVERSACQDLPLSCSNRIPAPVHRTRSAHP
jgi:hypothetical protein